LDKQDKEIASIIIEMEKLPKLHSICIPRVDMNVSKGFIFNIFKQMKIGYIEGIYEIPIRNDDQYKRILIKIRWNKSQMANYINERFNTDQNIKVVYSMPWYWICVSNRHIK
jgi:hypothetical protein